MRVQTKILSFVISSSAVAGALIIGITLNSVETTMIKQVTNMSLAEASELSQNIAKDFLSNDEISLLDSLQKSRILTHATQAMVLDQRGTVLAHTNITEKGKVYLDLSSKSLIEKNIAQAKITKLGLNSTLDVTAPLWDIPTKLSEEEFLFGENGADQSKKRIGTVRLTIPLKEALLVSRKIIDQIVGTMLAIGLVMLGFTLVFLNRFLKPIKDLAKGTAELSAGTYGVQIPVSSNDELGELAADFNRLSQVLAETTVSKDFMSGVFSNMLDPLFVVTTKGTIQMANQAALDLLRYSEEELIGKHLEIIFPPNSKVVDENIKNKEIDLISKTGETISVLYSISNLKISKGNSEGHVIVARDITERKRMETIIRRTEKMSAVGQLAAGVAHEINNPLGVILGFSQSLVRRLQKDDPMELPARSIEREAIRCKNLVQDLLTFSRVSNSDHEPLDLNKAIESSMSLIATKAKIANISIAQELSLNLPRISGNSNQLQQVLINLATNAIDAMTKGGTLTIKTENTNEESLSWVLLRVIDNGAGIPPDIINRILEPFFTTKEIGKGTGLGLSLVHEIVKKHSGTMEIQSKPGRTEFIIKFPTRGGEPVKSKIS